MNFLIWGDDSKISCLGVEKLMFFYSFPPKFFDDIFLLKSKLLGGGGNGGQILGDVSPWDLQPCT